MTLQELHELTGKVLKERPELTDKHLLVNTEEDGICNIAAILAFGSSVYIQTFDSINSEEVILWQSN